MYISPSLLATAVLLSFSTTVQAGVAQAKANLVAGNVLKERELGLDSRSFQGPFEKRQTPNDIDCTPNLEWNILQSGSRGDSQSFCNIWLAIPPATKEVEYTPIVTKWEAGRSTITSFSTTRITTTETVTETATATPAALAPRAANVAARINAANSIIESVIESGTDSSLPSATPQNSAQKEAQAGLSTACICMNVDPTSTVSITYTAPPQQTTLKKFVLRLQTNTITKQYTTTITVTQGFSQTVDQGATTSSNSSLSGGPSTESMSARGVQPSTDLSSTFTNSSTLVASTTSELVPTVITSDGGSPSLFPSNPTRLVATALPFSCPDGNGKSITNVVGNEMYEYAIMCNTALVTSNEILTIHSSSATDCAVECSYVNDVFQKDVCQAATFTATPGTDGGDCVISGSTSTYVEQAGATTVVLKGVYTSGKDCASIDFTKGPINGSIDSSAAISSIKATSVPVSIPGFVTSSGAGGVFHTYVSAGETGTDNIYRYSWYEIYASSSYWGVVYKTDWECTNHIPRTIVVQHGFTSVVEDTETTIINGGETTIISGTSTRIFTAGGGAITPTPVPASTTSGGAVFSSGFSTATQTASGGQGVQIPSVTPVPSGAISSQAGGNQTIALSDTRTRGTAVFSASGGVSVFNSTGGFGTDLPSPSETMSESSPSPVSNGTAVVTSGGVILTITGGTSTSNATGGGGALGPSQTSGAAELTISGGTSTSNFTGGGGSLVPSQTSGAAELTISGGTSTSNFTGGGGSLLPSQTSGAAEFTISGSIYTSNINRGGGSILPSVTNGSFAFTLSSATAISNFTGSGGSAGPLITSGGASASQAFSTATSNHTEGNGSYGKPTSSEESVSASNTFNSSGLLPTAATSAGSQVIISGGTAFTSFGGGSGAITPSPIPSVNGSVSVGTGVLSTGGGTSVLSATGTTGVILPSANASISLTPSLSFNASLTTTGPDFSNSAIDRSGRFSRTRSTNATLPGTAPISTLGSTGGSSGMPAPTANITLWPGTSKSETASISVPTALANSSLLGTSSSAIPTPSENLTIPVSTGETASLIIPTTMANSSIFVGTGSSAIPTPSANSSISLSTGGSALSSSVPTVSENSTGLYSTGATAASTAILPVSANSTGFLATGSSQIVASTATPILSLNSTIAPSMVTGNSSIPSMIPTASLNSSAEACPSPTQYTISYETVVITTVIAKTILVEATPCPTGNNSTLPTGTGGTPSQPTYSSSTAVTLPPSASAALFSRRVANVIATPEQIAAACADKGNIIFNPAFELEDDNNAFGWSSKPQDDFISFRTFPSTDQHTVNGTRSGRVLSAAAGRTIVISQPVTLCPGKQYSFSAYNRQGNLLAECKLEYSLGNKTVFTASPQEGWLRSSAFYVAGNTPNDVSIDGKIKVTCAGSDGATTGTDESGFMVAEFDDVSLVQDE